MKIMVLGAFGKSGRLIVKKAETRGHQVISVAHRKHDDINFKNEVIKNTLDLTKSDLAGIDAIIDAISAWTPETFPIHSQTASHILNIITGTNTQYIKIGGAGTIFINKEHTKKLMDWDKYPSQMKPLANVLDENLSRIRSYSNALWTYATPAFNYDFESTEVKPYQVKFEDMNLEELLSSHISYNDMAVALVDIVEQKRFLRQRIILLNK